MTRDMSKLPPPHRPAQSVAVTGLGDPGGYPGSPRIARADPPPDRPAMPGPGSDTRDPAPIREQIQGLAGVPPGSAGAAGASGEPLGATRRAPRGGFA